MIEKYSDAICLALLSVLLMLIVSCETGYPQGYLEEDSAVAVDGPVCACPVPEACPVPDPVVDASCEDGWVVICHKGHLIKVQEQALQHHLNNHGDYLGECRPEFCNS